MVEPGAPGGVKSPAHALTAASTIAVAMLPVIARFAVFILLSPF
jgi:hypothetical protein